jgi:hypothetical protein
MVIPFCFPAVLILRFAGPEEAKNLSGEKVLRQIQIRLATLSLARISPARQAQFSATANRRFKFQKRRQLVVSMHNETLSVAMCVNDPDCSPVGINH